MLQESLLNLETTGGDQQQQKPEEQETAPTGNVSLLCTSLLENHITEEAYRSVDK